MAYQILCDSCNLDIPVNAGDVGRMVVCPACRTAHTVTSDRLIDTTPRQRSLTPLLLIALLLLIGIGWFTMTELMREPQRPNDPQMVVVVEPKLLAPIEALKLEAPKVEPKAEPKLGPTPDPFVVVLPNVTPTPKLEPLPNAPTVVVVNLPPVEPMTKVEPKTPVLVEIKTRADLRKRSFVMKRIDLRSAEDLRKDLARFPEVSLDTPMYPNTSTQLFTLAENVRNRKLPYPSAAILSKTRPDLAGLPFVLGVDTQLSLDQAQQLHALSRELRITIQKCVPRGATDPRPDPDQLFNELIGDSDGKFRTNAWQSTASIPCIQQMLQPESEEIRFMSVELLRRITDRQATAKLATWAVFDISPDVRAACVDALRTRSREDYEPVFLAAMQYPWPRAAEHAAEALVALQDREVLPSLIVLLDRPDPDLPIKVTRDNREISVQREIVRVNHLANCVMCHAPSFERGDLVRGAVPAQDKPIPAAATAPAYYETGGQFVHADMTYLRQDFSVVQPVSAPGVWPGYQRYDYLVRVRKSSAEISVKAETSAYREAILFALRELSGKDVGRTSVAWKSVINGAATVTDSSQSWVTQYLTLSTNPNAALALMWQDFGTRFISLQTVEQDQLIIVLRREFGDLFIRELINAQLMSLQDSDDIAVRESATKAIERIRLRMGGAVIKTDRYASVRPKTPIRGNTLRDMLKDPDPLKRAFAARTLGEQGSVDAAFDLGVALTDEIADVRAEASWALTRLGGNAKVAQANLRKVLLDTDLRVRVNAATALAQLSEPLPGIAKEVFEALISPLADMEEGDRTLIRVNATTVLNRMGSQSVNIYPRLIDMVMDDQTPVDLRPYLISTLSNMGPPPASSIDKLAMGLTKKELRPIVAARLISAGRASVPTLLNYIKHEDPDVRLATIDALGQIGDDRSEVRLALAERKRVETVLRNKLAAIDVLARMERRP